MDAKVDFYWRNRPQIEEWAALRSTAAGLLDTELRAQADRLRESLARPDDVRVVEMRDPALVALTRPSWSAQGIELQVGLCWNRFSLLAATGMNRPWVGVRIGINDDQRRPLFDAIKDSARSELRRSSWTTASKNWPGWVWMEPDIDQDIALFARACGNEVIEGWKSLAPRLDDVVAGLTRTGQAS
jgi:hypothetical protein